VVDGAAVVDVRAVGVMSFSFWMWSVG